MTPDDSQPAAQQLELPFSALHDPQTALVRAFHRLGVKRAGLEFRAGYFAYAGLKNKIRLRDNVVEAYFSDLLQEAPPLVLEALAEILLAKLFRRHPSHEARECYAAWTLRSEIRDRADAARRERGFKLISPARGHFYDLHEVFHRVNQRFFAGLIPEPRLGWSAQRSKTLLGHYDSAHRTITVSRLFDDPRIPRYLMEYIMYHEILHIRFPVERNGHRRVVHSRAFRQAEQKFPQLEQVRARLRRLGSLE